MIMAALVFAGVASYAADGVWTMTGSNTPETAYLWNANGVWRYDSIPADASSVADFASVSDASSTRFIQLPSGDLSLKSVKYSETSGKLRLVGNDCVDFYGTGIDKTGTIANYLRVYSDVRIKSADSYVQFKAGELCGDILSSSTVLCLGSGPFIHRLDLYANNAGGSRISPMGETSYALSQSYGEFRVRCPESSPTNNVSRWALTANSRIARRVGSGDHALPVGTLVAAANGALSGTTFLRRIYDRDLIELSEVASIDGETDLTFAALTQNYEQAFSGLGTMSVAFPVTVMVSKYRDEDSARLSFGYLDRPGLPVSEDKGVIFDSETAYPGTVVLDSVSAKQPFILKNCHLEFIGAGLVNPAYVRHQSAQSFSRLTVGGGKSASITCLSNIVGRLVKDGAGVLSVSLPYARTTAEALINTGTISVEEGTLKICANDNGTDPEIRSLTLGAQGELNLENGVELKVGTLTADVGAVVSGNGVVLCESAIGANGIVLRDGARVVTQVGKATRERVVTTVEARVVGTPAFWVDATKIDAADIREEGDVKYVETWHDCREKAADFAMPKYLFATNVAGVCPTLVKNAAGADYAVNFGHHAAETTEIEKTEALVWSVPVSNIKAIFKVLDPTTAGGTCVLGQSQRLSSYAEVLRRTQCGSVDGSTHILNSNARARQCVNFLNGERVTRWSNPEPGYPMQSYEYSGKSFTRCVLHEIWNTNNVDLAADAFGFKKKKKNANGVDRICECLVYTNDLTYAERLQVAEYLTQKWCGGEATYDRFGGVSERIGVLNGGMDYRVDSADYVAVDRVSGSGRFTKSGTGAMYVDDMVAPEMGLTVAEGALTIRSVAAVRESMPAGAYLHLDASDATTITDDDGVAEWRDWRGADYPVATPKYSKPTVKAVAGLGGKNVVDFGDHHQYDSTTRTAGKGLQFAALNETRSVFFVYGSARGGGHIIGGSSGDYHTTGLFRGTGDMGADPSSPMISTDALVPRYARLASSSKREFGGSRFRLDGVAKYTGTDGFGGKYEVVSLVTPDAYVSSALSINHYANYSGGQDVGEAIIYGRILSEENVKLVEAYLRNKWFGDALPNGYRPACVSSLDVAEGATVTLCGNAPLTVGTLSGGGAVEGAVSIGDGEMVVKVANDGSTSVLTLGSIDLTGAASLRFDGSVEKLTVGDHVVISSASINAGDLVAWTASGLPKKFSCTLKAVDGALVATIQKMGFALVVH